MKVLKRNGSLQDFDIEKIRYSIANASDSIRKPLTEGDLHALSKEVLGALGKKGEDTVRFDELHKLVVGALRDTGFYDVAQEYDASELSKVNG